MATKFYCVEGEDLTFFKGMIRNFVKEVWIVPAVAGPPPPDTADIEVLDEFGELQDINTTWR